MTAEARPEIRSRSTHFPDGYIDAILEANVELPQTSFGMKIIGGSDISQRVRTGETTWRTYKTAELSEPQLQLAKTRLDRAHKAYGIGLRTDKQTKDPHITISDGRVRRLFEREKNTIIDCALAVIPPSIKKTSDTPTQAGILDTFFTKDPDNAKLLCDIWSAAATAFTDPKVRDMSKLYRECFRDPGRPVSFTTQLNAGGTFAIWRTVWDEVYIRELSKLEPLNKTKPVTLFTQRLIQSDTI